MKNKLLTFFLFILCAAGMALCVLTYLAKDRTAPKITLRETALTYEDLQDEKRLLQGVVASDNRDGNVSDSLVIEGIFANASGDSFRVVYAAEDSSGNVAKEERIVLKGAEIESETEKVETVISETETEAMTEKESETEVQIHPYEKIAVINASGVEGIAGQWSAELRDAGYMNVVTGSYVDTVERTVVYSSKKEVADELAAFIKDCDVEYTPLTTGIEGDVEGAETFILVGKNGTGLE